MNLLKKAKNYLLVLLAAIFCLTGCSTSAPSVTTATTVSSVTTAASSSTTVIQTTTQPPAAQTKKRVALTFDDGPHQIYTKAIVDELAKYDAHATFFVIGNRVDGTSYNGGSMVRYALEHGNEVGIHGYTHTVHYNTCTDEEFSSELSLTQAAISLYSNGTPTTLMRPIGGSITAERVSECQYAVIIWNVDSEDWKNKYKSDDTLQMQQEKVDIIVENVMSSVSDGSIILMHDIYESTYDAVKIILQRLYEEGYEVVTVSSLLGEPVPGNKYSKK